ncbi:MAG: phosphatidylserine/phosphatidylglycerophosphate/cardiolipin synthase family protein [Gammaproteobacteria bacterium]|nr:phosphatidylserine/phosphatidylglycerophosphate/cardiolipin synthase family protein [Gammaproteobacteria bacterium]MDH3364248.1 phosphatidylserine/phosphatidylglycerophosphate/cardiolipin synthase family protein [Gammaproteobacteria bacterium]
MNRLSKRSALSLLPVIMSLLLANGCASNLDKAPPDDMRTLPGRFAEEPVTQPLTIVEAFIGPTEFYVSYTSEDGLVHSGGNWSNKIDLTALGQGPESEYAGPYILPLEYQQRERWTDVPEAPIVPRILGSKYWNRFIDTVFESVLPKAAMTGIVMHFGEDDYFLYYNDINNFEARLITDKPENYRVAETIDFAEFNRRAQPVMDEFLKQEGIEDRRLVFSTGDAGAYSLPFVYVDRDIPLGIFVRYSPAPRKGPVASKGSQVAQSAGHLAHSHLGGLFSRPVSSVFRLLFVARDAAVETVRPTWLVTLESKPIPELNNGPGMNLDDWEKRLDQLTGHGATRGTIDYRVDGEEFFVRFIDAVSTAKKSVDIRTYIFDNDDFADKIGRLLRRRAAEGIDVRVLLDGLGTIVATGADDASLPADYEAPESVRRFLETDSSIDVRQSRNPWLVAGDHVKTTIIDGKLAFAGGMNIGREYRFVWHDLMMELRGPVVDELNNEFNKAWAHAGILGDAGYALQRLKPNPRIAEDIGYPLRVLHTRPGVAEIFNAQRAAIRSAKKYIYIQNAYLTDDAMLYELARARRRGVDVRVILPLVGNHGPINKSNALAANAMLEHGIRVFVYPGMSHVKAAVFDGWACLGSANWDKLSFRTNKELNIATSHPDYVEKLYERIFEPDFEKSIELTQPFPERWSDHLVEVVADYLL